jgi:cobalt-zinc-cadmium efflux system protein
VRESMNILLEGTPRGLSVPEIRSSLATINGVLDIHDLHVWSLGSQTRALATHVTIDDIPPSESNRILGDIREHLLSRYGIYHTTVQFEHAPCGEAHGCVEAVEEAHDHAGHQH